MADTHAAVDLANQGMAGGYMVETLGGVGGTGVTENGGFGLGVFLAFALAVVFFVVV